MSNTRLSLAARARTLVVRLVALWAMVFQVAFYADHLGATAAHELGRAPVEARLGFLEICTGAGVQLLDPATGQIVGQAGGAPVQSNAPECAICTSASMCSFDAPAHTVTPILQASLVGTLPVAVPDVAVVVLRPTHKGLIRAPPMV